MNEVTFAFIFKSLSIIVGFTVIYWGYKLFLKGFLNSTGNLSAFWGNKSIVFKNTAPGVFFTVFGASIILFSVIKGVNYTSTTKNKEQHLIADTLTTLGAKSILKFNADSLFEIGNNYLAIKSYMNAFKSFMLLKGASYRDSSINYQSLDQLILVTEKSINNLATQKNLDKKNIYSEETKSLIITEIDSIK
jgi:hypothetical protein